MKVEWIEPPPPAVMPDIDLVDSHVHFDDFDREGKAEDLVRRAREAGVSGLVAIGGSDEANDRTVRIASQFPGTVAAVAGFDRDKAGQPVDLDRLVTLIRGHRDHLAGIGESGLDYHYEPHTADAQKRLFSSMLELAAEETLPVVVHSREADEDTVDLLRVFVRDWKGDPGRPGVLHCFTGSYGFAAKLLDLGMMISFSGILTFRNADALRDCARRLPLDRILIETDAPYLAPVPWRGKTNEPAMVGKVAETLATVRDDALIRIAEQTSHNARFLFQPLKETRHE